MKRAAFLDRDGTLIVEKEYLGDPDEVEVLPGVGPALGRLVEAGYLLFMVTNQSGVGRGYFTAADVAAVNGRLLEALGGVPIRKFYIAPEAPDQPSRGRKPSPQFILDARAEFGVDLSRSYMVGDKLIDLQCGWNAGVRRSILVRTGYGARLEAEQPDQLAGAVIVDDLPAAVAWILKEAP